MESVELDFLVERESLKVEYEFEDARFTVSVPADLVEQVGVNFHAELNTVSWSIGQ